MAGDEHELSAVDRAGNVVGTLYVSQLRGSSNHNPLNVNLKFSNYERGESVGHAHWNTYEAIRILEEFLEERPETTTKPVDEEEEYYHKDMDEFEEIEGIVRWMKRNIERDEGVKFVFKTTYDY
jgi:hypothetical protein